MDVPSPLFVFMEFQGWNQLPLKHYWNIGYHASSVTAMMSELPSRLILALKRLVDLLDDMANESSKLREILRFTGNGIQGSDFRQRYVERLVTSLIETEKYSAWEEETNFGIMEFTFDSTNQIRNHFFVNSKAANFWKLSQKEIIECIGENCLPVPLPALDWISWFALYLATYFIDTAAQFLRFVLNGQAYLVCVTTFKTRDSLGRISEVVLFRPSICFHLTLSYHPYSSGVLADKVSASRSNFRGVRRRGRAVAELLPPDTDRRLALRTATARRRAAGRCPDNRVTFRDSGRARRTRPGIGLSRGRTRHHRTSASIERRRRHVLPLVAACAALCVAGASSSRVQPQRVRIRQGEPPGHLYGPQPAGAGSCSPNFEHSRFVERPAARLPANNPPLNRAAGRLRNHPKTKKVQCNCRIYVGVHSVDAEPRLRAASAGRNHQRLSSHRPLCRTPPPRGDAAPRTGKASRAPTHSLAQSRRHQARKFAEGGCED